MRLISTVAALAALVAAPVAANEYTTGSLVVEHPYSFVTTATAMAGAGYLTITNTGAEPDRLIDVEAPFDRISIHQTDVSADGVATMRPTENGILIEPGETVTLAPRGLHIMFMGLSGDPFEEGETIDATLIFEKAGPLDVSFNVKVRGEEMKAMDHSMQETTTN